MKAIQYAEEGYKFRILDRSTRATRVLVIEWDHPNYGYWADFGLVYRSLHMSEPEIISFATQMPDSIEELEENFPKFKLALEIMKKDWNFSEVVFGRAGYRRTKSTGKSP